MKKKIKILFIVLACVGMFFILMDIFHALTYDHEKVKEKEMHMYIER